MYLTLRSVWAMALGAVAVIAFPRPLSAVVWTAGVALAVLVDVVAAPSPRAMRAEREAPRAIRLGESATATLTIGNGGRRPALLQVRDAWPPSAGADAARPTMAVPAGERRRIRTVLTPTRRGDRRADLVTIRVRGPLGLAGRQASLRVPARVRVLPAFASRRHLPSRLARLREMDGRSAVNVRGAGTEFDSLREYVVGDDVRSIDWRSSARRGEVLVRTWRPERDRRVLVLIDTGRLAAARLGDEPRLDAQIEACLLLSALASRAGDRIDVVALDERVRAQVRGRSGPALMSALADALAPVDAALTETNSARSTAPARTRACSAPWGPWRATTRWSWPPRPTPGWRSCDGGARTRRPCTRPRRPSATWSSSTRCARACAAAASRSCAPSRATWRRGWRTPT